MENAIFTVCDTLSLLSGVAGTLSPLVRLAAARSENPAADWSAYYRALADAGKTNDPVAFMRERILADVNPASVIGDGVYREELQRELRILRRLAGITAADIPALKDHADDLPRVTVAPAPEFSADAFLDDWRTRGYGVFRESAAFLWDGAAKRLKAVRYVNPIRMTDLKEYEEERARVYDNTVCFLEGLPANNVLLYGDRGTGKSSTVHAVLNELAPRGLKLVELSKYAIRDLPDIAALLPERMRFLLFIDDLSFDSHSDDYAELKAALEGSVSRTDNMRIYATTNRRHILKETHSDRAGDDLHAGDTMQEQLSLSDRFGLTITFMTPSRKEFLSILSGILDDRKISVPADVLAAVAERWALSRGGRSPRAARQLADVIESRVRRGLDPAEGL